MAKKKTLPILCVDFDGVIHSYKSGWKGPRCIPDPPVDGAFEFLVSAVEHFQVCIYSSRSRYLFGRWAIKRWIKERFEEYTIKCTEDKVYVSPIWVWIGKHWGMEPFPHDIREGARALIRNIKFPTRKPAAFLQIDDRAMTFTGVFPAPEDLLKFKPWNKK